MTAVLVLGGGPAGCAAAITAAAFGLPVVLMERDRFPRHAPGETLHPGVQSVLRQLGVEDEILGAGFLRPTGCFVKWGGPEEFQPYGRDADGPWRGFQAWRPKFDEILLNRARAVGVEIRQPFAPTAAVVSNGRVVGVESPRGSVRAEIVVDATGRWRAVSRWLGLAWRKHGPHRMAWYGYAAGPAIDRDPSLRADAGGWTWVARVHADIWAWTRLNNDNSRPPEGWLPQQLEGCASNGPIRGAEVTWQAAERPAGPGYFLVGDAAATLDPASSHGVLKALMSGIYAGRLAADTIYGKTTSETAATRYVNWWLAWHYQDISKLDELYPRVAMMA